MEKRTCRLAAFGQSSELLVPLDRELLQEVIKFEGARLPPLGIASAMVGALTVSNESTVWHASRSRFHALYEA